MQSKNQREELTYIDRSPRTRSLIDCPHANETSRSFKFGPEGTVLIGHNGVTLVSEEADGDIAVQLSHWMEKASVLVVEIAFQELLC